MKGIYYAAIAFCLLVQTALAGDGGGGIRFIENKGQWNSNILYRADIGDGTMFFERNCLTFCLYDGKAVQRAHIGTVKDILPANPMVNHHAFKIGFAGANMNNVTFPLNKTNGYYNYYIGKDKSKWKSHVNGYQHILYRGIYNGIDLSVKASGLSVKYEFTVAAGVNPNKIALDITGAEKVYLNDGDLIIQTSVSNVVEKKPYAFQEIGGRQVPVECNFVIEGTKVRYNFPNGYDSNYELIIDPNLVFCSYSGAITDNWGFTATYDNQGNLYGGGVAFATGYPTTSGAFQQLFGTGSCDATISKYSSDGTTFLFSTYLGGSNADQPHSMIVNSNNELYVYGSTGSADFPVTTGAYDATFGGGTPVGFDSNFINFTGGSDIFIARFKADGSDLLSSTYYGGSANDGLNTNANLQYNYADQSRGEIYIDLNNNIYIGSTTLSIDLPVTNGAFQTSTGGVQDGCIAKFDNNLSTLQWASYLGGSTADAVYSIIVGKNNNVYVTGGTTSQDFPTSNGALHPNYLGGSTDAFVAEISSNGQQLIHSTYFGSSSYDQSFFVQADKLNNVYIIGQTEATGTTLIQNAQFNTPGGNQFIAKFDQTLGNVIWSTAWGKGLGKPDIVPSAFLVDVCNKVYVSGWGGTLFGQNANNATCTGLPLSNDAFQSTTDGADYYLLVIDDQANSLIYGTYFGGGISEEHVDGGTSRFDKQGVIYQSICAGCGGNSDLPTTSGSVSQTNNSTNCNNGVFKFNFDYPLTVADFAYPTTGCAPYSIQFNNLSIGGITYSWDFGDGSPLSSSGNPQHTFDSEGTYTITLIAQNPNTCNISDTISKQITIFGSNSSTLANVETCPGIPVQIGIPPLSDPNITYSWTPANLVSNPTSPNPTATVGAPTTFTLLITNGNCVDTLIQPVTIAGGLTVNAGPNITLCQGQSGQIGTTGNTSLYTYQWSPSGGLSSPTSPQTSANPSQTTTYILTATAIDTTGPGCDIGFDTVTVFVTNTPPAASLEYTVAPGCDKLGINLDNTSGGTGPFYWDFGNGSIPSTGADTSLLIDYNVSYTIKLIIGNAPCSDTATITINALGLGGYLTLNNSDVFTPFNGDNINTCFSPGIPQGYTLDPSTYPLLACSELTVYNRWGRKVFEGSGCWDGYTEGGSQVTEGVYYYIFKLGGIEKHGTVTVLNKGN